MSIRRGTDRDAKPVEYHNVNGNDRLSDECGHIQNDNGFDSSTIGLARTTYSCDLTSTHAVSSNAPQDTVPSTQRIDFLAEDPLSTTATAPSPPRTGKRQLRSRRSLTQLGDAFSKALNPVRSGVHKALNGTSKLSGVEPLKRSRGTKSTFSRANLASSDKGRSNSSRVEAGEVLMQPLPAPLTAEYVQFTDLPRANNEEIASQYVRSIPGPQPMSLVTSSASSGQWWLFQRVAQLEAQLQKARNELLVAKSEVIDSAQKGISRIALESEDALLLPPTADYVKPSVDLNFSQRATDAIEALLSDLQSQSDTAIPAPLSISRKRKADVIEHYDSGSDSAADGSFKPPVPLKDMRRRSPRIRAELSTTTHRRQGDGRPSKRPSCGHRQAIASGTDAMDLFKSPVSAAPIPASLGDSEGVLLPKSPNVGRETSWPLRSDTTKVNVLSPSLGEKENLASQAESRGVDNTVPLLPVPLRRQVMSVIIENDDEVPLENTSSQGQRDLGRDPPRSVLRSARTSVKGLSPKRTTGCSGRRQLYGEVEGRRIWDEEIF